MFCLSDLRMGMKVLISCSGDMMNHELNNLYAAGTGDHTFERRLRLGGPLLKQNIATMVLER